MARPKREYIGVIRNVDKTGRVSLPIEFRKELEIETTDDVEIRLVLVDGKKVIEIKKRG